MLGEKTSARQVSCRVLSPAAIFVLSFCFACSNPSGPEISARAYIEAVQEGRCDEAHGLLSARTQQALVFISQNRQRAGDPKVEGYYCGRLLFHECKVSKLALVSMDGGAAAVSLPCGRTQDGIVPGTVSPFLKYEPRNIDLVLENGDWRVVEAFVVRHLEIHEREQRAIEAALSQNEDLRKQYEQRKTKGLIRE